MLTVQARSLAQIAKDEKLSYIGNYRRMEHWKYIKVEIVKNLSSRGKRKNVIKWLSIEDAINIANFVKEMDFKAK